MKTNKFFFIRTLLFCLVLLTLLCFFLIKIGLIDVSISLLDKKIKMDGGGYSYLNNSQYFARTSLFDEYELKEADIVFVGDSIIQRCDWGEFFCSKRIANRGIGSDTTIGLLNRLDQIISLNPEIIFIMIGINDISEGIESDATGNITTLIKQLQENTDSTVYLLSILPTFEESIDPEAIVSLNSEFEKTCITLNCGFINIYELFFNENGDINKSLYASDGVHLSGEGYRLIIDSIQQFI